MDGKGRDLDVGSPRSVSLAARYASVASRRGHYPPISDADTHALSDVATCDVSEEASIFNPVWNPGKAASGT